jgi:hypothetical protein
MVSAWAKQNVNYLSEIHTFDRCAMIIPMKPPPKTPEFARFTEALRQIVQVPKKEVAAKMNAAKQERQQQRKRASGHVSRDKG